MKPKRLDRFRWWLCLRLMPPLVLAAEKRRLEQIGREMGASKSQATGIASTYFRRLL